MQRFTQLAAQVQRDVATPAEWSTTYSGCDIGIYLYAFSYEPQDGNAAEAVRSTLRLGPNARAAGEIQDRYRNLGPLQGIGYPMFTLERLIAAAEILRIAGFDPYAYRGRHEQSIEMALAYYACFGKRAGFGKTVTAENSASCPNAAQYYGKIVDGVDQNETFGAYRFPNDQSITEIEAAAKTASSSGPFSLDAILFGKWRD
jgi:hypothetical protein